MLYEELLKSFNGELEDIHLRISTPMEEANLIIALCTLSLVKFQKAVEKNGFQNIDKEISFFKSVKVIPMQYLIYYTELRSCELNIPKRGDLFQIQFLENLESDVNLFFNKHKEFLNLGMATSAVITDFDNDSWLDIIIVGEWMPIRVFKNMKTEFREVSSEMGLNNDTTGWWWSIKEGDFDNDGDVDFIVGNNGLNYKYKATEDETFDIYVNDFDNNNKEDIVLSYYSEGEQVPVRGRSCSSQQIPGIKQKFKDYNSFSEASLVDVYTKEALESSLHYQVKSFASVYLENKDGQFIIHKLPIEAQFSSINQILVDDYDSDGNFDALIAGNLYVSEVETPRNDASFGYFLKGNGKGDFKAIEPSKSGVFIKGDTKDLAEVSVKGQKYIVVAKNDDYVQFININ